ncbi:MAG: hypothetical protein CMH95_03895 [Oceanospirillaceae bacterium]|nr:hypothetical protein [Oceanospirillaceae bacterium]
MAFSLLVAAVFPAWASPAAQNQEPLILEQGSSYLAGTHWQYRKTNRMSVEEAGEQLTTLGSTEDWLQSNDEYLNLGVGDDGYWFTMRVRASDDSDWFLRNRYSLLDTVALFQCPEGVRDASQCHISQGGDRTPYTERAIDHPNLILPLHLTPGNTYDLYLYVTTEGSYQLPVEFVDQTTLNTQLINNGVFRGAYYAVMLAMALYNLILFFAVRDRLYLYYTAFVSSFLFFHMNFEGSAFGYFWPEKPELNAFMVPLSFAISQFFFALFLPQLLMLKNYCPKAAMVYRVYVPVTLGFAILSIAAPYQTAVSIQNYVNSLLAIYTLIAGIRAWTQGHKPAKYFTIAWVVFMMGVISANMSTLGVIPGTPLTLYGYQMGSVFDVILISLAMGARINMLREAQQEDQRRLSDSQSQAIRYLKQYEDLYQNSISARFQLNSRGEITDCNPAFAAALGFLSVEEVVESKPHFDQFIASPHASIELWEALGSDTKVTGYELILMPRRGKAVNAILTMRQEASDQGYQWVGSFLDVTEKYDQEAALRKLEDNRNQSLQQLVMGVSHEMNTPLGNIRLATTHIKGRVENNEIPVDDELKIAIHQVTDNISRLAKLNQLIQSSMGASSSQYAESIYLRAWLGEWKQRTQHQHRHLSLEVISYPDTALWRGYTTLLEQVLNQLTENAVVHNAQKYEEGALYVRVATSVENGVLDIEFKDNGRGISACDREKMFLPFFTTRRSEATKKGLGLYEVKNLVTNIMKGSIVSPDSSQGLTLNIRLPEAVKVKEDETDSDSMVSW